MNIPWSRTITFADAARGLPVQSLEAGERERRALARELDLVSLESLVADVKVTPWLDGVELNGRFEARVVQTCSVTADDFEETVAGDFTVRVVPQGSPAAPAGDSPEELELDPEADDPPDVAQGETIDLAAYVAEHLALELDPFPRKPGAVFEAPPEEKPASPFAVLRQLKPDDSAD